MRFRGYTGSSQMLTTAPPLGRQPSRSQLQGGKRVHHVRRGSKATIRDSVVMAKKKEQVKANVAKKHTKSKGVGYSFVYVGNIEPSITKERLEAWFSICGTISCIQLRCSRGRAITVGVAVPEQFRNARDRQYATVEFSDANAAKVALGLNGRKLDGCELVVSISPADLPEVQDIVESRIANNCQRQGLANPYKGGVRFARPIPVQDTEEVITAPAADRHRLFGVSFAKCVT